MTWISTEPGAVQALRSATIAISGATQTVPPAIPAEKQAFLDAIHGSKVTQ